MLLKDTLKEVVLSQRREMELFDVGIARELEQKIDLTLPLAVVISGIRRSGKSTLLRQIASKIANFYYFNFEDLRVATFEVGDFEKLDDIFHSTGSSDYYFFDEIQNVDQWELFIRKLLDNKKHVFITGSNASLLSRELGTRLTGRHLKYELFPFSYLEFLNFTHQLGGLDSFQNYLQRGGFPEYLKYGNQEILRTLLNDILVRDIAVRHNLRSLKILKEMAIYLITNIGKEFSYNSLKTIFGFGSTNSVIDFVSYLEDSYLLFTIPKFDYSLKKQAVNPKKVYSIDNGISSANSTSFSSDIGRMLENTVFLHLRREYQDIYYFKGKKECDFVVKEKSKIKLAIQVCYKLDEDNKEREVGGVVEAMEKFGLNSGVILTLDQEDELTINNKKVKIIPVWRWITANKKP